MGYQFNKEGYSNLLSTFAENGYRFETFDISNPAPKTCFIRHDIDFDLDAAVTIAKLEAAQGISASYFILTSAPFYNIFEQNSVAALRKLASLGHKIGLHYDVTQTHESDMDKAILKEAGWLSNASGQKCEMMSFHRPLKELLRGPDEICGLISTYGKKWMVDAAYMSDSTGAWRFGMPTEQEAFINGGPIQLLTHPIWWHSEEEVAPEIRLREFLEMQYARTISGIKGNSTVAIDGIEG
ncbi:hypothetical protein [Sphingorhabdus lutea]|uniref:hypothetical protein n=1 Tax=Sphingorhabdus lutea TaxID=1913578 RepID=UPI0012EBE3A3|nr:hypothetical protein [Sphingorhabdus lutea]